MAKLIDALERTRKGYKERGPWHQFLLDAYTGGGGFEGSVKQADVGWWGALAERYAVSTATANSGITPTSYLDKYPREDQKKHDARRQVAHYTNIVQPLTDLKVSYLLRKPPTYHNQPDTIGEWRLDIDGKGTTWDEMRPLIALMCAIWGWTPALIDMDPAEPGMSRAQADELGLGRPRFIPLTPANLLDWSWKEGAFEWVKIRTDYCEQPTWDAEPVEVSEYRIWTPEFVEVFEVRKDSNGEKTVSPLERRKNPFGVVPLIIFRHHAAPGDEVCGLPMHAAESKKSKRLFNLDSEFDEHVRSQVFAILVLALKGDVEDGEVDVGADNGLTIDPESAQKHYYLSPDPGIAATFEKRIEAVIREIYRMARVEFQQPSGAAVSGVSHAYEFAQTNRALADFAAEFARGEHWMDEIVWRGMGKAANDDAFKEYSIQPVESFDIEDLANEIKTALDALTLELGPTATKRIKMRVVQRLLPNLAQDQYEQIEQELDDLAAQQAADAAAAREMLTQNRNEPPPDPNEDPNAPPPGSDPQRAPPPPPSQDKAPPKKAAA